MSISLRYRLLLVPLLIFAGTAAATAIVSRHAARSAEERIERRVQAIRRTLYGPPTFPLTLPVLLQIRELTGGEFVVGNTRTFRTDLQAEHYREYAVDLPPSHPDYGTKAVLYFPESIRRDEIDAAVRPVLWLGIGAGVMATVLSLLTGRRLVWKIRDVQEGTKAVAAGDFQPLPLPTANDELRDLTISVNAMAAQLAANEERLKQTERLRVLGQIRGGLAHQLRNAAAGAKLALQLHAQEPGDPEPLEVARQQLERLEAILRQFLEAGPMPAVLAPCNLGDLIRQAIALKKPQAEHHKIQLIAIEHASPVVKPVDAEQFEHLLDNLLGNALDAAGEGGEVRIELDDDRILISDSGPGVPPEIAGKLFEPFASSKPGGIGLGLCVARQIAEAHNAKLHYKRIENRTQFTVRWN